MSAAPLRTSLSEQVDDTTLRNATDEALEGPAQLGFERAQAPTLILE